MFSGTGFFTDDGTPAMIYHGEGSNKNFISYALDDNLDEWSKPVPVEARNDDGTLTDGVGYWDPDLWRNGDTFYSLSGGKNPKLMKSTNLNDWKYMGELLHEDYPADIGVAKEEDISCANMFKIGDKWMLLCISHYLGARYYLGDFKDEKYLPESHHMMNFQKNNWDNVIYFAPESMLAEDGRRVMWAWIINGAAPSAIQGLPRELYLPDDGILRMKPLKELEDLRYEELTIDNVTVSKSEVHKLEELTGDAIELEITFTAPLPAEFGLNLLADKNGNDGLTITAGANKTFSIGTIKPPFELENGEDLTLRIFIDKNLVEVFANDRQAACWRHDYIRKNPNISLFTNDADVHVSRVMAWKMKSIYN
jgi:sucrose-6-phosphate hydrolase SacC (GH32 family)